MKTLPTQPIHSNNVAQTESDGTSSAGKNPEGGAANPSTWRPGAHIALGAFLLASGLVSNLTGVGPLGGWIQIIVGSVTLLNGILRLVSLKLTGKEPEKALNDLTAKSEDSRANAKPPPRPGPEHEE